MAVSILDEASTADSSEFFPFDDSKSSSLSKAATDSELSLGNPAINTSEVDQFRQGVEISTQSYRFKGLYKIWSGQLKGITRVITYGQPVSFTEFENSMAWEENDKFNPVAFIELGENYNFPIVFNDGPSQAQEAIVRPLSIPFLERSTDLESAHDIRASLEEGNQDTRFLGGHSDRISQFINFRDKRDFVPFLDDGVSYIGNGSILNDIITPGFLNEGISTIPPYDDLGNEKIISKIQTTNNTLLSLARVSLSFNLDEDIREINEIASMPAGWDSYGPNQRIYGTDSLAYLGIVRGG
jgi:hypothetical protein